MGLLDHRADPPSQAAGSDADGFVLVSFYSPDDYYRAAARQLTEDCIRLGIAHDIVELAVEPGASWIDNCRRKLPFIGEMFRKHRRPVFWLDVDSRLSRRPALLDGARCDFAAFLRGFRYLRDFDAETMPRFFSPFALYFNATPKAAGFLELMLSLEAEHPGQATDDYFLQEAWRRHQSFLSVLVLPPDLVGRHWPLQDHEVFYVGISGHVSAALGQAEQHVAPVHLPARRKAVLVREGQLAMKESPREALMLWRRALQADGPDDALALRIARLLHSEEGLQSALSFLRRNLAQSGDGLALRYEAEAELGAGEWRRARAALTQLRDTGTAADRQWAADLQLRVDAKAQAEAGRKKWWQRAR